MNACLLILRVAFETRETRCAERAGLRSSIAAATPSQQRLRRSSVAAALQPSTQLWLSSSRPSSRCCQQHLEEGPGGTSRGDASCAQHELRRSSISSVAAASGRRQCPATMSGRRGEKHLRAAPRASLSSPSKYLPLFRALATATSNCRHS